MPARTAMAIMAFWGMVVEVVELEEPPDPDVPVVWELELPGAVVWPAAPETDLDGTDDGDPVA